VSGAGRPLARRYARALLDVARGAGEALAVRDELRALVPAITGHESLWRALVHPGVSAEAKGRALAAVAQTAGASAVVRRLFALLGARDRVALLPEVAEAYADAANAAQGVVAAEAVSAVPLSGEERRALEAALGGAVELRARVDPDLLGGLLVSVGGTTYDGSVRARLAALGRRLAESSPGPAPRTS
jgi:F-type H+-transporting ATPase subunit delta